MQYGHFGNRSYRSDSFVDTIYGNVFPPISNDTKTGDVRPTNTSPVLFHVFVNGLYNSVLFSKVKLQRQTYVYIDLPSITNSTCY